jgi:hypothetical protein
LIRPGRGLLALALLLAGTPGSADAGPGDGVAIPWQSGIVEVNRYSIEINGKPSGEIEQRLYGEVVDGVKRYRVNYDVVRQAMKVDDQSLIGRIHIDILFGPDSFETIERTDRFAVGVAEGRIIYTRTPTGFRFRSEGTAEGIAREPLEEETEISGPPPLVDQMLLVYVIRSLPLEEGHQFGVSTYNPSMDGSRRLKGMVAGRQIFDWEGESVEAQRIETSAADGVTTYYVATDGSRRLFRYAGPNGEVYQLQRPKSE